jgi:hypothetical protein
MTSRSFSGGLALCALIVACTAGEAHAEFVQTVTCQPTGFNRCEAGEEPKPVRWYQQQVPYRVNERGSPSLHPHSQEITDELKASVFASFDAWNEQECSEFEMVYEGTTTVSTTGYDQTIDHEENINVLIWREDDWPHSHFDAVALTTVTYRPSNGVILSADIEFNTDDYLFTDTDEPGAVIIDFRNTLTHEIGHFLGLDHSPNSAATMYATAPPGETSKRTLHQADIDGLCHIYPLGQSFAPEDNIEDYVPLQPISDSNRRWWCSTTPGHTGPTIPAFALVLFGLFCFRRVLR